MSADWKLVPVNPPYTMLSEGMAALVHHNPDEIAARAVYRAMLAAAPAPPPIPEEIAEWIAHMDLHVTEHDDRHAGLALRAAWPTVRKHFMGSEGP